MARSVRFRQNKGRKNRAVPVGLELQSVLITGIGVPTAHGATSFLRPT